MGWWVVGGVVMWVWVVGVLRDMGRGNMGRGNMGRGNMGVGCCVL